MGGEKYAQFSRVTDTRNNAPKFCANCGIQSCGRLIHQKNARAGQQYFGNLHPSTKPARKTFHHLPSTIFNAKRFQILVDPLFQIVSLETIEVAVVTKIFTNGQFHVHRWILKKNPDLAPHGSGKLAQATTGDRDFPILQSKDG